MSGLTRREVRLGCWLERGGARVLAFTSDLSANDLSLQLAPDRSFPVEVGEEVSFRLLIDAESPLDGTARVAWVDTDDRDVCDRRVVGLGLGPLLLDPAARERLHGFLSDFRYSILVLEEDSEYASLYGALGEEFRLFQCQDTAEAFSVLERQEVSALLVGEELPDGSGCLTFLQRLNERFPNLRTSRVVVCEYTVAGQLQLLVNLGQLFAFLRKPFGARELEHTVRRAIDGNVLRTQNQLLVTALKRANERFEAENAYLRRHVANDWEFDQLIGKSAELRRTLDSLARVQRTDATVHLWGETGTGKELLCRALHAGGKRASEPLIVQSCAGLAESLLQCSLLGFVKGAFTGAERDTPGIFQRAHGGTLFLDDVSELSPTGQAALLRVLQEGEVRPLGGTRPVPVDVRLVSACNKDLRAEVKQGRFREDLYFRLVVVSIRVPSLRERTGDVSLLAMAFLDRLCERWSKDVRGFSVEAMRALERYPWPGNVRELENELERLVVLAEDDAKLHLEHLSPHLRPPTPPSPESGERGVWIPRALDFDAAVALLERTLIRDALAQSAGNTSQAARALNMERSRLAKLKDRLGLGADS